MCRSPAPAESGHHRALEGGERHMQEQPGMSRPEIPVDPQPQLLWHPV